MLVVASPWHVIGVVLVSWIVVVVVAVSEGVSVGAGLVTAMGVEEVSMAGAVRVTAAVVVDVVLVVVVMASSVTSELHSLLTSVEFQSHSKTVTFRIRSSGSVRDATTAINAPSPALASTSAVSDITELIIQPSGPHNGIFMVA